MVNGEGTLRLLPPQSCHAQTRYPSEFFHRLPSHLIEGHQLFNRDEYDRWAMGLRGKTEAKTAKTLAKLGV